MQGRLDTRNHRLQFEYREYVGFITHYDAAGAGEGFIVPSSD